MKTFQLINVPAGFSLQLTQDQLDNVNPELMDYVLGQIKAENAPNLGRATLSHLLREVNVKVGDYEIIEVVEGVDPLELTDDVVTEPSEVVTGEKNEATETTPEVVTDEPVQATEANQATEATEANQATEATEANQATEATEATDQPQDQKQYTQEEIDAMKMMGVDPKKPVKAAKARDFQETGTRRKKNNREEFMGVVREGTNGALIKALEAAGFKFVYAEPSERWYHFEVPFKSNFVAENEGKHKNPTFVVSALKKGGASASLYIESKSVGDRVKFDADGYSKAIHGDKKPSDFAKTDPNTALADYLTASVDGVFAQYFK
ncbi:hypothetical protein Kuja_1460 [Vibrio phage vB_VchM_Kuja]|uniref:Uncharacterized protein n=1 Tax=Vibrio phage vB_VchM_Kuja TaxID=2686437 RepID=A0A6B9JHY5_9CAUD|nr:hypothetical protein HWC83_gp090 [Vibrio phage vB_VchM_Kuja]QGZ16137.1 hypothetical protein Kuja_1460 [Vibrio phage vB_VchM_Kuja]